MQNPTTTSSPPAARSLRAICEDARRGPCAYCSGQPGEPGAFSGTGPDGYHIGRFAAALKAGLVSGDDLIAVVREAMFFTLRTVIYDAPDGAR